MATTPESPPGPPGLPVVGNTHQFGRDALGFLSDAATYGDIVGFRVLGQQFYQLNPRCTSNTCSSSTPTAT